MPYLFSKWSISFKINVLYSKSTFLSANFIKIVDEGNDLKNSIFNYIPENNQIELVKLETRNEIQPEKNKFFEYHLTKYYFDNNDKIFKQVKFDLSNQKFHSVFSENQNGLSSTSEIEEKNFIFGNNILNIPEKSTWQILIDEILNPFNLFQIFSITLWFYDEYKLYATMILIITIISIVMSLIEIKKNNKRLREMLYFQMEVLVLRNNNFIKMMSNELVPGDIIKISENSLVPADLILFSGTCIVTEAVLTGESIPVKKHSIPKNNEILHNEKLNPYLIYCGSFCLKTNPSGECIGLVYRTGFHTFKGNIAKELLFHKIKRFNYLEDSFKYIAVFVILTIIGYMITIYPMYEANINTETIIIRSLELVTTSVPPALPACMEVGIEYAMDRLREHKISCLHPSKINIVGKINLIAFDKTGTLTEDGLCIQGCIINNFDKSLKKYNLSTMIENEIKNEQKKLLLCLSTCHSITKINDTLSGDPIDLEIYKFSKAILKDSNSENSLNLIYNEILNENLNIIRIFEFDSSLQRMSTLFTYMNDTYLSIKGSPEMLHNFFNSETIPDNYQKIVKEFSIQGYRIISLGIKKIEKSENLKEISREKIEKNLDFLGFLIFENKVKENTYLVMDKLIKADIKTVMVTGDNPLTAICVGRQCKMVVSEQIMFLIEMGDNNELKINEITTKEIEEKKEIKVNKDSFNEKISNFLEKKLNFGFAMTGESFDFLIKLVDLKEYSFNANKIFAKSIIFARMKPFHKSHLIMYFKERNQYVLMTGDGANDCVAMKKADVGLSLSQEESSLASDFTSSNADISSLITILRQGRAAIVTSVNCFKFLTLYSMIQFISLVMLYCMANILTDMQFIYGDMVLVVPLSIFMNRTRAAKKLTPEEPEADLMSFLILSSVLGQVLIMALFQIGLLVLLMNYKWYISAEDKYGIKYLQDEIPATYENSALTLIAAYQYLITAYTYCEGKPFRKRFIRNYQFLITFFSLFIMTLLLNFLNYNPFTKFWNISKFNFEFKSMIFLFGITNFIVIILYEKFNNLISKKYFEKKNKL